MRTTTGYTVESLKNEELRQQLQSLDERVNAIGGGGGAGGSPTPCATGIMLTDATTQLRFKRVLNVSLCVNIPAGTARIAIVYIRVADATSADSYDKLRKKVGHVVEEAVSATGGEYSFLWSANLEYSTQYRVIRIIAIPDTGDEDRTFYPATEQAWNDAVPAVLLFTTPDKFGVPSSPSLSLITINRLDPVTVDVYDAEIERIVFAPTTDAGAAQSYGAAGVDQVHAVLKLDGEVVNPNPHILSDEELTQVADGLAGRPLSSPPSRGFVRIRNGGLTPGRTYNWPKNIVYTTGERKVSTGPAVQFVAANLSLDPSLLTSVSLVFTQSGDNNPKHVAVDLLFTQPAQAVALRWITLQKKFITDPDSAYVTIVKKKNAQSDEFNTAGAKTFRLTDSAKFKPSQAYTVRVIIDARGGNQRTVTQNVTTGTNPDVEADTTAPQGLQQPVLDFIPGKGLHISGMVATSQRNTENDTQVVIYNGGGAFLDIPTWYSSGGETAQTTSEAAARYSIGGGKKKTTIDIPLKALKNIFGVSGIIFGYYYKVNSIGPSAKSADSVGVPLSGSRDNQNERQSIDRVAAGVIPPGQQILPNADCLIENPALTLDRVFAWDGATLPISGAGNNSITTTSSNVRFNRAGHNVRFLDTTRHLNWNIRKGHVQRGEIMAFACLARANTTLPAMSLRLRIKANDTGQDNLVTNFILGGAFAQITLTGLDATYREYYTLMEIDSLARTDDGAAWVNQFFLIQLIGTLGANQVDIFRPVLVRGAEVPKWVLRPDDFGLGDAIVTEVTETPEVTLIVGSTGGGFDTIGQGGAITRYGGILT